jgi:phosphatidylserine/phosphatidylglycerophosphate/cardiolipin synthase-like enzyme
MGTHAKYWICDRKVAYVGSHNVLSSNTSYLDLAGEEVGTLHTSPRNIQKLINCFETQPDLSR